MDKQIKRTELEDGDIVYVQGHRGIISNIHLETGRGTHAEHGQCTQRYQVTSSNSDERALPYGYNGGTYGGCIINNPNVWILEA